jgi:maltose alpha-D-glucosyltransferase/alpha-amylase
MSMPGTPIIYYGDEIGMGDNIFLGDRDAVRTPMQWTSDRNAGFSRTEPARLYLPPIMDPVYGYESVNVEAQSRSAGSLLNWMKRIISVRKAHRAFGRGTLEFLHPGNRKVIAYLREHDDESILCVANLSRSAQPVELDLARFRGRVPVELLGNSSFPPLGDLPYFLTLPGYGFYWFRLAKEAAAPRWHQESPRYAEPPVVVLPAGRETAHRVYSTPLRLPSRQLAQLEREALPNFLGTRRWFAAKGGEIERVEVVAQAELADNGLLTLLRVHVDDESSEEIGPQLYFLPLAAAWEEGDGVSVFMPHALAKLRRRARMGLLFDAMADEQFCRHVVETMGKDREVGIGEGRIRFSGTDVFGELIGEESVSELSVRRAEVEQTNSSVILGERLILKAYRRLQKGTNPDLEIGRYLTEEVRFENTPPLAGAIEYEGPDGETTTLGLLQGFVENQGDGWSYVLDYLGRYLEDRLVTSWSPEGEEDVEAEREERGAEDAFFASLVRILGQRTGELHAAFAAPTDDASFAPEHASPEEVAGWAEGILAEARRTLDLLKRRKGRLPEEAGPDADRLLALRRELTRRIKDVSREGFRVVKTRHHGDYHLGQVLVVGNDFQIIDFEGEPARPLAERRRKHSPLRDVAGMLRSFNYAIRSALMNIVADRAEPLERLEPWITLWEERTRQAFLEGYAEGARGAASYPENEEHARALIELFTLEKALYEIRYELDNRPDWVGIPIRGVLDLLGKPDGEDES